MVVTGCLAIAIILILTTIWSVLSARKSTEEAVHSVSDFYLKELAGRREQVVSRNLSSCITNIVFDIHALSPYPINHSLQFVKLLYHIFLNFEMF